MERKHTFIVDASFDHDSRITGIGMAIHEADKPKRNGILIDQLGEAYKGIPTPVIEMLAVYRALEIGRERKYELIRIRSDHNQMRRKLKMNYEEGKGFQREDLFGEIMRITRNFKSVQFGYKPRRKNQMAHILARRARTDELPIVRDDLIRMCNYQQERG